MRLQSRSLVWRIVLVLATTLNTLSRAQRFNYEIEKRIRERLDFFLSGPLETAKIISNFRNNGGFPNQMQAEDRDIFLSLAYSLPSPLVYFGLEDGTCPGYYWSNGYYREPGNSGYAIDNLAMKKHLDSCVDAETGQPKECLLPPGADYIECQDGLGDEKGLCEVLEICPGQPSCEQGDDECNASIKWCRQYSIVQAPEDGELTGRGYIPITNFCHNDRGQFSQEPNTIIDPLGDDRQTTERTSCTYNDGSLVQRTLAGAYAACGSGSLECDTVFAGGYSSSEYDPRYRPWYIETKERQRSVFLPPYPFFTLGLGVTYTEPIYTTDPETGRKVFAGVVAVDYRLEDIADFLSESYGATTTAVIVYEDVEPYYVIASSTASPSSRLVLSSDKSQPCPVDRGDATGCEPVRLSLADFGGHPMDPILVKASQMHIEEDYPENLLSVKATKSVGSQVYVSQSTLFKESDAELSWRVVVVEPGAMSTSDSITLGDQLFGVVIVIAGLGIIICSYFAMAMYHRREERAIVFADWRFTIAFIIGCILFNGSTFALLGENTKGTCLMRMWTFHICFVLALSPLFVKVWRMYKLVGSSSIRKSAISNAQAALYTTPMILVQVGILLIFTFVDPPQPKEYTAQGDGVIIHGVVCESETSAAFITLAIYEFGFVFAGCILAYLTRNMKNDFGEAKQMIFSMYNVLFVGLVVVIVVQAIGLDGNEQSIMQAIGVFWGTTFSAGSFVIPRLVQAKTHRKVARSSNPTGSNVHISGLENRSQDPSDLIISGLDVIHESELEEDDNDVPHTSETTATRIDHTGSMSSTVASQPEY